MHKDGSIKFTYNNTEYDLATVLGALLTATSADEGKVLMIDSNGRCVLGTMSGGYPLSYTVLSTNVTLERGE